MIVKEKFLLFLLLFLFSFRLYAKSCFSVLNDSKASHEMTRLKAEQFSLRIHERQYIPSFRSIQDQSIFNGLERTRLKLFESFLPQGAEIFGPKSLIKLFLVKENSFIGSLDSNQILLKVAYKVKNGVVTLPVFITKKAFLNNMERRLEERSLVDPQAKSVLLVIQKEREESQNLIKHNNLSISLSEEGIDVIVMSLPNLPSLSDKLLAITSFVNNYIDKPFFITKSSSLREIDGITVENLIGGLEKKENLINEITNFSSLSELISLGEDLLSLIPIRTSLSNDINLMDQFGKTQESHRTFSLHQILEDVSHRIGVVNTQDLYFFIDLISIFSQNLAFRIWLKEVIYEPFFNYKSDNTLDSILNIIEKNNYTSLQNKQKTKQVSLGSILPRLTYEIDGVSLSSLGITASSLLRLVHKNTIAYYKGGKEIQETKKNKYLMQAFKEDLKTKLSIRLTKSSLEESKKAFINYIKGNHFKETMNLTIEWYENLSPILATYIPNNRNLYSILRKNLSGEGLEIKSSIMKSIVSKLRQTIIDNITARDELETEKSLSKIALNRTDQENKELEMQVRKDIKNTEEILAIIYSNPSEFLPHQVENINDFIREYNDTMKSDPLNPHMMNEIRNKQLELNLVLIEDIIDGKLENDNEEVYKSSVNRLYTSSMYVRFKNLNEDRSKIEGKIQRIEKEIYENLKNYAKYTGTSIEFRQPIPGNLLEESSLFNIASILYGNYLEEILQKWKQSQHSPFTLPSLRSSKSDNGDNKKKEILYEERDII